MRLCVVLMAAMGLAAGQAGAPNTPALDGIAHVAFRVSDISASREFYRKLGFEQAFEFKDAGGATTSYLKVNDRQFIELYRRDSGKEPLGLMHICFDVSEIDKLREIYLRLGLQPTAASKGRAGNLLFSMRDPEGQLLEYTQYLPGSLHWNARGRNPNDRRISDHLARAAVAVKNVSAERAFYIDKLGFVNHSARLRAPGNSGEALLLEARESNWKPRIEFTVDNVRRAAAELRQRGLTVSVLGDEARVTDPDGVVIAFTVSQ